MPFEKWRSGFNVAASVVELDESNFDRTIASADFVFVNFYADWCRFSHLLKPIFDETAQKFTDNQTVILASVNCDEQPTLSSRNHISKYPTLKIFRFGRMAKREYRGNRNVDALFTYISDQAKNVIHTVKDEQELRSQLDLKKRNIVAYVDNLVDPMWKFYRGVASNLRDDCKFYLVTAPNPSITTGSFIKITFIAHENGEPESEYSGALDDHESIEQWISEKCVSTVRELTFENAEDLTEEGLPFMVLFRQPDDSHSIREFVAAVKEMPDQKNAINFLYADGLKFAHPLHHLGKTQHDLPLVAIDSFRHMYLFPDFKQLRVPGKLKEFVEDMHSGKLHREFHHGPDPAAETTTLVQQPSHGQPGQPGPPSPEGAPPTDTQPHEHQAAQDIFGVPQKPRTSPPLSVFQKLKPSRTRYTLKDEL